MSDSTHVNTAGSHGTTYEYRSLAHKDSIRLIELLLGTRGTPLTCNIIDVRKSDLPQYEALSYAWGEATFFMRSEKCSRTRHYV
jgi:hypothetical protein